MTTDQVADAVLTWVNAGSYSQSVTATKTDNPKVDRETDALAVQITPFDERETKSGRNATVLMEFSVNVLTTAGITSSLTREDVINFVNELKVRLRHVKQAGATWTSTETVVYYDASHIREYHQATSLFRLTYQRMQ